MEKVYDHSSAIRYAKRYCREDISRIENYYKMMADSTQRWVCHHRREIDESKSRELLIEEELYYSRPASELVFLTHSEHTSLHHRGKHLTEEQKLNISAKTKEAMNNPDVKENISEAMKEVMNRPGMKEKISKATKEAMNNPDVKEKIRQSKKGKHWWNNGVKQVLSKECPEGYLPGMLQK